MKRIICLLSLSAAILAGCGEFDQQPVPVQYQPEGDRVLILYLAMNNNLASFGRQNVYDLLSASSRASLAGGRILIYAAFPGATPALLEVKTDGKRARTDTLVKYPAQNSVRTDVLRAVLDDAERLAPSSSYGLIVGSHATGWLASPNDMPVGRRMSEPWDMPWAAPRPDDSPTRVALTETGSSEPGGMTLEDFAATLRDDEFDYILFDACMMGGVETLHELRQKTDWIIASPAEDLVQGFPYGKIVTDLMAPSPRLAEVCRKFYDHYNSMTGDSQTATVGLYDCSQAEPLASAFRSVVSVHRPRIEAMSATELADIQNFDREAMTKLTLPHVMFDAMDFVESIPDVSPAEVERVRAALEKAVVYKAATPWILMELKIDSYCGIYCNIPTDLTPNRNAYYFAHTAWGKEVWGE